MNFILKHSSNTKSGGHRDIVFKVESLNIDMVIDSYYIIDNMSLDDLNEDLAFDLKVNKRLVVLLEQSLESIDDDSSQISFLPIDISDQGTGWLYFEKVENSIMKVGFGYSSDMGFSINLNDISAFCPEDYKHFRVPIELEKETLVTAINKVINGLKFQCDQNRRLN